MPKLIKTLIASFLLMVGLSVQGQDWRPVLPGKTQLFVHPAPSNYDSTLHGFRTTFSERTESDSIFHFNTIYRLSYYQDTTWGCGGQFTRQLGIFPDRENVAGYGVIFKLGNEFWFFGPDNDTLVLKPRSPIGVKWGYHRGTSDSAWVALRTTAVVGGVPDSVLTIHTSSGKKHTLSKHYGFTDWEYFYRLVSQGGGTDFHERGIWYGIPELGMGRHLPSFEQIYENLPGEQYGHRRRVGYYGIGPITHFRKEITSRTVFPGRIDFGSIQSSMYDNSSTITYTYAHTVNYSVYDEPYLHTLPWEESVGWVQWPPTLKSEWDGKVEMLFGKLDEYPWDTCFAMYKDVDRRIWRAYATGLGQTYDGHTIVNWGDENILRCYNKNPDVWNFPCSQFYNPIAIDEATLSSMGIELFPQPATDRIFLRTLKGTLPDGELQIISANGSYQSFRIQSAGTSLELSLSGYAAGIYFLRYLTEEGPAMSGKFILLP